MHLDPQLALAALNHVDHGVIVADLSARVWLTNEVARIIIARCDAVTIDSGELRFLAISVHRDFVAFRNDVRSHIAADGLPRRGFAALRSTGQPEYRVLMHAFHIHGARAPYLCIRLHDPPAAQHIDATLLQQLYQLTSAEAQVTASLFAGLTVERITHALQVSENTVRTHLKAVFAKCNVKSQAQLMQLIALGPHGVLT
ncbi:MAG: helix-turn-helix transcriptional regulator [Steroidobacter sp.]